MSSRVNNTIERQAQAVLDRLGVNQVPVDIEAIAGHFGIRVIKKPLEDDMSGVLVVRNGQAAIGVNENHPSRRQRFTIAHEIAHYLLHIKDSDLFVDSMLTFYRDDRHSVGAYRKEREANAFAAALLMPCKLTEEYVTRQQIDLYDEAAIQHLADQFNVSEQALTIRLMQLDLLTV